jgi:hypothetical protein
MRHIVVSVEVCTKLTSITSKPLSITGRLIATQTHNWSYYSGLTHLSNAASNVISVWGNETLSQAMGRAMLMGLTCSDVMAVRNTLWSISLLYLNITETWFLSVLNFRTVIKVRWEFLSIQKLTTSRWVCIHDYYYCNKFAGSISRWKFITLQVQYTTLDYSSQLFYNSNTRITSTGYSEYFCCLLASALVL